MAGSPPVVASHTVGLVGVGSGRLHMAWVGEGQAGRRAQGAAVQKGSHRQVHEGPETA